MKKWKLILVSAAVAVGIGGAFASTKQSQMCPYYTQYRIFMGGYVEAGEDGVDYACVGGSGVCTYYRPSLSSPYLPCRTGAYYPLNLLNKKK
ncbi:MULTISPECIES: DUF6520 family protein [Niastella]|uniref:Secreted protein n=1 Tax=Niastella soli TaxID=2821487 RepID=A0ABS3Z4M2_9BACT|nr:DUF6520 family protein [Niastella soli]MBO9204687.1 hypothetical protein [Niastella soli]